jgi:hypothetical protein
MTDNPNFTAMTKANIAAWAKEHHGVDMDTNAMSKDAMVAEVENEIARRVTLAPELPPGGTVEPAPEPVPAPEPALAGDDRPFRLMIRSAPCSDILPLRVNGKKHDLPIGKWIDDFDKSLIPLLDDATGVDYITME